MKGMVSVTPISAYKGCFFVENARKAQWLQERGSFTVRGEVFALRRWSPEENSVVRGKFRRGWLELRGLPFHLWDEVQLSHILQQWGRVTKVARNSLKFVDLSKVTLWVEMLPKVVLPALLEVEDGDWTYTVAVTVTGEDDGEDDGGCVSSRSKDELRSPGGYVLLRDHDRQRWMPRHRLRFSSSDSKSAKGEKGKGRWVSGPMAGSNVGPTPDAFEARSVWAQVGAKEFGPIAGPAHNGSPNGGPAASSSSKLQRPGLSAKNKASEGLLQASSKKKGSPVSVRRRARSGPPRFDEASSSLKRSFEGGGSLVTNRGISRGQSHSRKSDLSSADSYSATSVPLVHPFCVHSHSSSSYPLESSHAFQRGSVSISPVVFDNHRGGASCSKGVVVPLETSNQKSKDRPFLREILSSLEVHGDSGEASFPVQEPSTLPLEGFQVEGLTPRKMVKVQSVLESLRVRIVRDNGKGVVGENRNPLSADKILSWNTRGLGSRKKRRTVRRFLSTQNSDVVMLQETKREIWDRRLVSSIWKGKSLDWVALPACGASGGIVILWDSVKFNCSEKVLGSFSVTVKLNSDEEGSFWLTSVYGPNKAVWREDFWLELQDLHGLTFPRWCVGGDFNVIRRICEKMGDSRLTDNMRRFDEFIRESGLVDPPLRNAAFTWSNMQVDPICKRFENMWLLHPEFKEKFRDWWQECTVEGWEGHKFMRKLKIIKSKLKEWNIRDLLLKEEVQWRQKSKVKWIKEGIATLSFFTEGETLNNIEVISEEIVNFFGNLYSKPEGDSWKIEGIDWAPISEESAICLYKIIAKVLSGFKVLHETIFGSQGAFVEGRQILDAVLIANEVVDEKRRSGEEGIMCFKGVHQKWRSWMRGCLSSSSFAILVNGNVKGWVKASRGLRQEILFLLSFYSSSDVPTSLDLLQNLKIILLVLGKFRFKINLEKAPFHVEWPLSYLGLPLGGNPKTIGFWDPVIERISRRLDGWKKAYLSLGGRMTLIQSCLSHIPSYFLSLFKIPVSIASKIEKMQRDFLWSGAGEGKRDHLIRWEVVSRPREMGERSGLWHKVIASIYGTHPNGWDANMVVRWSHRCPWKAIAQVFQEFSPFVRLVVGNGERIRFWEDLWWGNQTLCAQFAELYRVSSVRNLTVSNVLGNSFPLSWNFNFRRNLTDSEIDLLQRLMSSLHSVLLSPSSSDSRAWSLSSSGSFSVKSFFNALSKDSNPLMFLPAKFLWSSKVPSKVKALAWLVAHGKVNTNDKLQLRRPYKALCPQWCILCKGNGESIDHLFLHCPVTIGLWHRLFNLVGVIWVPPRSIEDIRGKILWQIACLTLIWMVWQERNNRIFEDKGRTEEVVWDLIRFYSSLWASCLKLLEEFL
ncbi:hypothetical protein AAG906_033246 [Vitis piasezkii]